MLQIKYNSQTLTCKQKQRCGCDYGPGLEYNITPNNNKHFVKSILPYPSHSFLLNIYRSSKDITALLRD